MSIVNEQAVIRPSTLLKKGGVSIPVKWRHDPFDYFTKNLFVGRKGLYYNVQDAASISDLSEIKDLSGNNNHASQSNAAKRASLVTKPNGYKALKFDGFDDFYQTANIDFSATEKVTVISAFRKLSDAAAGVVFELGSDTATINGTFGLYAPRFNGQDRITFASRGSATALSNIATVPSPISGIVTAKAQISTNLNTISFNGGQKTNSSSTDQGAGNYSNNQIFICMRSGTSLPFNGELYALLIIDRILTDVEISTIESEFAKYL